MTLLKPQQEWELLQDLEHHPGRLPVVAARLKRKLQLRRIRRGLGIRNFDLDAWMMRHLRSEAPLEPMKTAQEETNEDQALKELQSFSITSTPYEHSFASRLYGKEGPAAETLTASQPWISTYMGRKLRPFIWRDYESCTAQMDILVQINARRAPNDGVPYRRGSIDYCYFQRCHLTQVNELLSRLFWPGIDMTEALLYPEFSVVALYKRMVIGCAFMTPEAYITYIGVAPGWKGAGIGTFMLYHLIQLAAGKDVTLHVSATNPAMILYQRFGFKPEEFIVNFYDKYLPECSKECKNAFLVRLRR